MQNLRNLFENTHLLHGSALVRRRRGKVYLLTTWRRMSGEEKEPFFSRKRERYDTQRANLSKEDSAILRKYRRHKFKEISTSQV